MPWSSTIVDLQSSGRLWLPALRWIEQAGYSTETVLSSCGLHRKQLEDHDARVPLGAGLALLRQGAGLLEDPLFAPRAGQGVERESFGLVALVVATLENRAQALSTTERMTPLVLEGLTVATEERDEETNFYLSLEGAPLGEPQLAEYLMGLLEGTRRRVVELTMQRVEFVHPARAPGREYRAIFDAPVLFEQEKCGVIFPTQLDPPFKNPDPVLAELLSQRARAQLAELPEGRGYRARVLAILRVDQDLAALGMARTAETLRINERTLRRRLGDEGTTFAALLDAVRQERALALIEDCQRSLERISEEAGFNSAGAFRRAFRRWTGESPRDYRRRLSGE